MISRDQLDLLEQVSARFHKTEDVVSWASINIAVGMRACHPELYPVALSQTDQDALKGFMFQYAEMEYAYTFSLTDALGVLKQLSWSCALLSNLVGYNDRRRDSGGNMYGGGNYLPESFDQLYLAAIRRLVGQTTLESLRMYFLKTTRQEDLRRTLPKLDAETCLVICSHLAEAGALPEDFSYCYKYSSEGRNDRERTSDQSKNILRIAYRKAVENGKRKEFLEEVHMFFDWIFPPGSKIEVALAEFVQCFNPEDAARLTAWYLRILEERACYGPYLEAAVKGVRKVVDGTLEKSDLASLAALTRALAQFEEWMEKKMNTAWEEGSGDNEKWRKLHGIKWDAASLHSMIHAHVARQVLVEGEEKESAMLGHFDKTDQERISQSVKDQKERAVMDRNMGLLFCRDSSMTPEKFKEAYGKLDYWRVRDREEVNDFLYHWLDSSERLLYELAARNASPDELVTCFNDLRDVVVIVRGHCQYLAQQQQRRTEEETNRRHREVLSELRGVRSDIRQLGDTLHRDLRHLTDCVVQESRMTQRYIYASGQALYDKLTAIEHNTKKLRTSQIGVGAGGGLLFGALAVGLLS